MSDHLNELKLKLKNNTKPFQPKLISNIRKSYIEARNCMRDLDNSLYWINIVESVTSITVIMLNIYIITVGIQIAIIKQFIFGYITALISFTLKMIINCFLHGLVYEENENLFIALDELDISHNKLEDNIKALYFKIQTIDAKFGLTITGTIAYRKSTLVSVIFYTLI